ncbi:hypothetical protein [Actinoallomurus sp. NPDC052274]|uniref:hypothetical protein n=1 Tax=Actinoallomurus sp. NPDC052274 TaxID=3155420 RepID=UPI0034326367
MKGGSPLPAAALPEVASATAEDVVLRLVVALTGVHALRPAQIRLPRFDQVNLPDRRLDLDGTDRLLEEFGSVLPGTPFRPWRSRFRRERPASVQAGSRCVAAPA